MGDPGTSVIQHAAAVPIGSPTVPTPAVTAIHADANTQAEGESGAVDKDAGLVVPVRKQPDGLAISEPGVKNRQVDKAGIGGLDDDVRSVRLHRFLLVTRQVARLLRAVAHDLDRIEDWLRAVGVCLSERG